MMTHPKLHQADLPQILCALLLFLLWPGAPKAQSLAPPSLSSAEILHGIQKLNVVGSVLYVAAHPDDENTRLLTYLSKESKLRVGYISTTRGDGGQNLVGKEQGVPLGILRTQELMAARRIDGAEQFFARSYDFGYSKNPEETFAFWNYDSVLADVVWVIRTFKPDVIVSRFPTTGEGGHGHHTAAAILAVDAFDAAADPKRFPHQLKHATVWQAKRVVWNTFNFGGNNTTSEDQLKFDVGGYNALLGKSYGEIAALSRSQHASQGFGSLGTRGTAMEYFKHLVGDSARTGLTDGVDITWKRIAGSEKIQTLINAAIVAYNPLDPSKSLPDLLSIRLELNRLSDGDAFVKHWKQQKLKEVETLLLAAAGLWFEAQAPDFSATPGTAVSLTLQAINRSGATVTLRAVNDSTVNLTMEPNMLYTFKTTVTLPRDAAYSNPYWLNDPLTPGYFTVRDQLLIGKPENDAALRIVFGIRINGQDINATRPVIFKYADPAKGEIYRPLEVLPAVTVNFPERAFVFITNEPRTIPLVVRANKNDVTCRVDITAPDGWIVRVENPDVKLARKNDEAVVNVTVAPSRLGKGSLSAVVVSDGKRFDNSIHRIEYDHVPHQFYLTSAVATVERFELKTTGTNIAFIPGAGDDVPAALRQVGYTVTELTDAQLANQNLSQYDAIVTGVRAYNTNDRLQVHYNKLMDYVRNGGNLVVQYNTNNRIGPLRANIAPYPFTISRERVTDEKADVRFLHPDHASVTQPNKITQLDFENWIQERSIYQATEIDSNYTTIFSMNDPHDKPGSGSLIVAPYGKGNFVYTGLVFFRQLPAGNPGAFRLFANLLALPRNNP